MLHDPGPVQRLVVLDEPSQAIVCNYSWGGPGPLPDASSLIKIGRALAQFAGSFDGQEARYARLDAENAPSSGLVCEFRGGLSAFILYSPLGQRNEDISRTFAAAVLNDVYTRQRDALDDLRVAAGQGSPGQGESEAGKSDSASLRKKAASPRASRSQPFKVSKLQNYYKGTVDSLLEHSLASFGSAPRYTETL